MRTRGKNESKQDFLIRTGQIEAPKKKPAKKAAPKKEETKEEK